MKKTWLSPFKVPDDSDFFLQRITEKEKQKEERHKHLALSVQEKMNHAGQRELRREEEEEEEKKKKGVLQRKEQRVQPKSVQSRSNLKLAMMTRENIKKESMQEFTNQRRHMLRMDFALMVTRSEIKKLQEAVVKEERRLKRAEQMLEDDTLLFEEFLKENDRNSTEAVKTAEQETKSKLEKMAEIKRLTTEMMSIQSEISKNEEILKDYKRYKEFLFNLSPPEWQEAQRAKTQTAKALRDRNAQDRRKDMEAEKKSRVQQGVESPVPGAGGASFPVRSSRLSSRRSAMSSAHTDKVIPVSKPDSDSSEYEDEPELYFSDPQQLLDLLTELEEQNLTLILNSTETEEELEELRQAMETNKKKMEEDAEQLTSQINVITENISREKERAARLQLKARLFNYGKFKTGEQDNMLDALSRKVEEVYRCCVDDKKTSLDTLQMLTSIEDHLSMLLDRIEIIPAETLEKVKKIKDKERRIRQREEKQRQQKQHQEERLKKSLERSQADIKKTTGRKLMFRSKPAARKIKLDNLTTTSDQDRIDAYLFT
ncbi:cilia- and flagella-associated protein 100 [Myripristis murdjan]|uniref:cilia- and flagella-associated protein 100 n=1 Tax=Myripristis murdjan TaxID=586833 RepID=UPI001175DD15|nr:cilia- and flagella-associated protein 100 [Myripristis murdjan]